MSIIDCNHQVKSLRSRGFKLLKSEGWFQTITIPSQGWFQTIVDPTISSGGFKPSLIQPFQVVVAPQP
jgi:hypothetical protein